MGFHRTELLSRESHPTAKNRVWGFFGEAAETRRQNRPQPRRENRLTTTKVASGRTYWPSRDPIGERGGTSLYGLVGNNAVGRVDIDGRSVWGWALPLAGGAAAADGPFPVGDAIAGGIFIFGVGVVIGDAIADAIIDDAPPAPQKPRAPVPPPPQVGKLPKKNPKSNPRPEPRLPFFPPITDGLLDPECKICKWHYSPKDLSFMSLVPQSHATDNEYFQGCRAQAETGANLARFTINYRCRVCGDLQTFTQLQDVEAQPTGRAIDSGATDYLVGIPNEVIFCKQIPWVK